MHEMLIKKYRLEVEFFGFLKRPKTITFEYEQGKFKELLEMRVELSENDQFDEWLYKFLVRSTKRGDKFNMKLFLQLGTDQKANIFEFILKTYAKGFFKKSKVRKQKSPSSSLICLILEKTGDTLESVLSMTWEQIDYLIDGVIWNLNAQSKEGEKRNQTKWRNKQAQAEMSDEEALEQIKILDEKLKQKNLKN